MKVKIIDFGKALQIVQKDGLAGVREDVAETVRKFFGLFTGNEFESEKDLRNKWRNELILVSLRFTCYIL